jgi:F-type H+-transporting ATPase subunit a
VFGFEYPSIEDLVEWPTYFGGESFWALNKIGTISLLAMLIPVLVFVLSKKEMVPRGFQNVAEGTVEFVENQVILPVAGPEGMRYLPLLLSLFLFVFFGNLFEVIPTFQMPANARMANPLFLALVVFCVFVYLGFKNNGIRYFTDIVWPSYVPLGMRWLVGFIEFFSVFILRPFSLAVRLFANMLAGHILLVTFGVLTIAVFTASALILLLPLTFGMLVILTAFEIFVSFLQAFVFALLTAVYIDSSLHPAH